MTARALCEGLRRAAYARTELYTHVLAYTATSCIRKPEKCGRCRGDRPAAAALGRKMHINFSIIVITLLIMQFVALCNSFYAFRHLTVLREHTEGLRIACCSTHARIFSNWENTHVGPSNECPSLQKLSLLYLRLRDTSIAASDHASSVHQSSLHSKQFLSLRGGGLIKAKNKLKQKAKKKGKDKTSKFWWIAEELKKKLKSRHEMELDIRLMNACSANDVTEIEKLIQQGAEINARCARCSSEPRIPC